MKIIISTFYLELFFLLEIIFNTHYARLWDLKKYLVFCVSSAVLVHYLNLPSHWYWHSHFKYIKKKMCLVYIVNVRLIRNMNYCLSVVLLIGEPRAWETDLQLLIDLLLTEGKPTDAPKDPHNVPQIPLIACNMDLVFMAEACMPRFGHGAFLLCLEALYQVRILGKKVVIST